MIITCKLVSLSSVAGCDEDTKNKSDTCHPLEGRNGPPRNLFFEPRLVRDDSRPKVG